MAISIGLFLTIPMRIYGDNMFEMTVRWIPESCGRRRWIGVNQSIFLIFHVYLSSTWGDGPISSNFTIFQTGLRPPKRTRGPLELISRNRKTWRDHATDIYIYMLAYLYLNVYIYSAGWFFVVATYSNLSQSKHSKVLALTLPVPQVYQQIYRIKIPGDVIS